MALIILLACRSVGQIGRGRRRGERGHLHNRLQAQDKRSGEIKLQMQPATFLNPNQSGVDRLMIRL